MAYLSDIEIAQSCKMKPIGEIAEKIGITDEYLEPYGKYKAKIGLSTEVGKCDTIPIRFDGAFKSWKIVHSLKVYSV